MAKNALKSGSFHFLWDIFKATSDRREFDLEKEAFSILVAIGFSPDGFDHVVAAFDFTGINAVNSMEDNADKMLLDGIAE